MERAGFQGPEAAQIAAHSTRDRKRPLTPAEVSVAYREMAADFGSQPERVIATARERALSQAQEQACRATQDVALLGSSYDELIHDASWRSDVEVLGELT